MSGAIFDRIEVSHVRKRKPRLGPGLLERPYVICSKPHGSTGPAGIPVRSEVVLQHNAIAGLTRAEVLERIVHL